MTPRTPISDEQLREWRKQCDPMPWRDHHQAAIDEALARGERIRELEGLCRELVDCWQAGENIMGVIIAIDEISKPRAALGAGGRE